MNRTQAWPHIEYAVDDSLNQRRISEVPPNARLVGWHRGYSPVFVAVWSYLPNVTLGDEDAAALASGLLEEEGFFKGHAARVPDYIL